MICPLNKNKLSKNIQAYRLLRDQTLKNCQWGGETAKRAAEKVRELTLQIEILECIYNCLD